jgi:soluble lytic murein transglycosylase-like protein
MKSIKIALIILSFLTIVNIITWRVLDHKIAELKVERNQIIHSNWELLKSGDIKDIFDYIQDRNPKITVREMAEYVSYAFQLADDYQNNQYPVTVWEIFEISDIESSFVLNARGSSGEYGPMQLLPKTWNNLYQRFGFQPVDFKNWYCNMVVAVYLYSQLKTMYHGDAIQAIGFYNGGHKWQQKAMVWNHIRKYKRASRGISKVRYAK